MTFFPDPIRPSEGREDDELRVQPIEADKKGKEDQTWELPEGKKRPAAYTAFLMFIRKVTDPFGKIKEGGFERLSTDALTKDILELQQILQTLMESDQSKNGPFCSRFSATWHRLLQEIQVQSHTKRKATIDIDKLKAFLTDIDLYPASEDHKLGFYLSEFAGESWLPVPFREILKQLFVDHRANKPYSILVQWNEWIDEILQR